MKGKEFSHGDTIFIPRQQTLENSIPRHVGRKDTHTPTGSIIMAPSTLYILLGLLGLGILVSLIWRFTSRRQELPCPSWLGWMVEMDNPFTEVNRAAIIVEHLGLEPGVRVLDAGCGPGRLTLPLAAAVGPEGQVLALDIQEEMLSRTRGKVQAAGLDNVQYIQAGLGEGKLPSEYFDHAVLVTVLGEIPDQASALQEINKTLKPGGILSVTEVIFDPHFQRQETVVRLAETAGFREKELFGHKLAYTLHFQKP
jgi:2-polyprenyl-3-methyl-5-hydroxy-6-metoxy-1,4-benzoquinol methylase